MKRLLAIILVLSMVFGLVACGGSGDNGEVPAGDTTQGTQDSTQTGTSTDSGSNGGSQGGSQSDSGLQGATTGSEIENMEYAATVFNSDIKKNTSGGVSVVNDLSNTY